MKGFLLAGDERWQLGPVLLGSQRVGVCADGTVDALVRCAIVIRPDCDDAVVVGFPSTDQPGPVPKLHGEQVRAKEVME